MRARLGLRRNHYTVSPGLYAIGNPSADSPVLVTANYKLSFDSLRFHLDGTDCWLLVVDTRGVNVWCAAGKGTFSTAEVLLSVRQSRIAEVVTHRRLILPQLAAPGVAADKVRSGCGFSVLFGPIRAADLQAYLTAGCRADESMRTVTFGLGERAVLIPVELTLLWKPLLLTLFCIPFVSAIGPDIFSLSAGFRRAPAMLFATLIGIIAGTILTPLLLPCLPGRQFWWKGLLVGLLCATAVMVPMPRLPLSASLACLLWTASLSSYLAMNFTGSTPFTSPSGVAFEMRRGIPIQLLLVLLAALCWLYAAFAP